MIIQIMPIESHVATFCKDGKHTVLPIAVLALHKDDYGRTSVRAMLFAGGKSTARFADECADIGELVFVTAVADAEWTRKVSEAESALDELWEKQNAKKES